MVFDALLLKLEEDLRACCDSALALARTQLTGAAADLVRERTQGYDEIAMERAKGLADVAKEKADLHRVIAAMQKQEEAQQGRVVLDIGGYRYTTSVQTLRRLPGTFFDSYFSGRYTMDRSEDGSIFIDRDGEHFGHVLEYLRDGVVSVAERDASELDVGELRWLKREFGFYCIELHMEEEEVAFVAGGTDDAGRRLAVMERYEVASCAWREVALMATARTEFGLCELSDGYIYAIGGVNFDRPLSGVERYDPCLDTWSAAPSLPLPRYAHCVCSVGDAMYVLGGIVEVERDSCYTVSSMLKFDIRTQTWCEMAPMPAKRDSAALCVRGSDVYVFGGSDGDHEPTSTTYRFSTDTNEWVTLAPMPEAISEHSVCELDGYIYVVGGLDRDENSLDSVHRFDLAANSWSVVGPMCATRNTSQAFVLDGSIFALGGFQSQRGKWLSSMERYNVELERWSLVSRGELGTARTAFGACVVRFKMDIFDSLIAKAK
jgi:hypothetical protein